MNLLGTKRNNRLVLFPSNPVKPKGKQKKKKKLITIQPYREQTATVKKPIWKIKE